MTPGQIAYRQYLQSDHWRSLRAEAYRVHGRKCYKCPKKFGLDVHHLRYRWPWESCVVEDVRPCCRECHEQEHGIVRVIPQVEKRQVQKQWKSKREARKRRAQRRRLEREAMEKAGIPVTRRRRFPKWWPGMYEGKAPYETMKEVGTNIYQIPKDFGKTPASMNPKSNRHK